MKTVVSRIVDGERVYPFDEEDHIMIFDDYDSAKLFLLEHDYKEEDIGKTVFIDDAVKTGWDYIYTHPLQFVINN